MRPGRFLGRDRSVDDMSPMVMGYCAAFRQALRLRRELSILSRSSGRGGDRESLLGELALAVTAMNSCHDACMTWLRTREPCRAEDGRRFRH